MKRSVDADAVLDRVLTIQPWIAEDCRRAGKGRYARVYEYRKNVSLQALYTAAKGGKPESLEVGFVFDDLSRDENTSNLADYQEQLGDNESKLGLKLRDGDRGGHYYLTRFFPLAPDANVAYEQATRLCLDILDLVLGGPEVRRFYQRGRDEYARKLGATS